MTLDRRGPLERVPLFAGLAPETLADLSSSLKRRTFPRGTILFHKDQVGDALYLVDSGRVRIFLPSEGGHELTVGVAGPGDVIGELALLDRRPRSASAAALEDTIAYTLGHEEFQQHLAQAPGLAAALLELLSTRLRYATEYAESLAFLDVHARVARILLEMVDRYGVRPGGEINIDVTQSELATMVGAARERVNRALAAFRAQGLVEVHGKRIAVRDPERLKQRIY